MRNNQQTKGQRPKSCTDAALMVNGTDNNFSFNDIASQVKKRWSGTNIGSKLIQAFDKIILEPQWNGEEEDDFADERCYTSIARAPHSNSLPENGGSSFSVPCVKNFLHFVCFITHSFLSTMRPLTKNETETFFEKLSKYIGGNVRLLIDNPKGTYCFRLHRNRVYYVSENILKLSANVSRDNIVSVGTCFGKFTKTGKFHLHVTALNDVAQFAKYKIWLKPGAEQQFLYGNHIVKSGIGRITEATGKYQGVIVYSMNDLPLGFGVSAKSTQEIRTSDPTAVVCFHQADIGEYIRNEGGLV